MGGEKTAVEYEVYQKRYRKLKEKNDEALRLQKKLSDLKTEKDRIEVREMKARIKFQVLKEHLSRLEKEIESVTHELFKIES